MGSLRMFPIDLGFWPMDRIAKTVTPAFKAIRLLSPGDLSGVSNRKTGMAPKGSMTAPTKNKP